MKLSRESFLNIVENLCNRPKLYTKNGTFWEVLAFIQGFAHGSGVHGMRGSHAGIQDFFHWLEKKVGVDEPFKWFSVESFYAMHPSDEIALKNFANFYYEFCQELPEEEDEIEFKIAESKAVELSSYLGENEKFEEIRGNIKRELWRNSNERDFLVSKENNGEKLSQNI